MEALTHLPHSNIEVLFTAGAHVPYFWLYILALGVWSLVLKGYALWYSARNGQYVWFVALLLFSTFGLLEIVYLVWFQQKVVEEAGDTLSQEQNKGTVAESD